MPTYDYKCIECGYYFETVSTMAERHNPKCCPQCGGYESKQVITRGNAVLDSVRMGRTKVSEGFRDTLIDIKAEHPNSTIKIR